MKKQKRKSFNLKSSRLVIVLISMALQVTWIVLIMWILNRHYVLVSVCTRILALLLVLVLYWKETNAAFKMPWMILTMTFPILGISLYFLMGRPGPGRRLQKWFDKIDDTLFAELDTDNGSEQQLRSDSPRAANLSSYIRNSSRYPLYQNTEITFFDDAAKGLEAQIRAMREAEQFIFLEYHAFEDAQAFRRVKEILYEKAKQGVDVRMIYDDVGCVSYLGPEFRRELKANGVKCRRFNPVIPILSPLINNRDHKKITVIDGKTGFTGGYNLTDEYFNITHPYGHWKDTGVKLRGSAVNSFTVMFLEMWDALRQEDADYEAFLPVKRPLAPENSAVGFVQPYADTPLDTEPLGENIYMNMIKMADRYVWFTTPYLIISDEMARELILAAKRGVDVRIITPGIPDKKMIYQVTRSYYEKLLAGGVRIYEYTPGFLHAKQCICDDNACVVGTVNLDYRSLYLHFEDGVFFYGCSAAADVKRDFLETFAVSREVKDQKVTFRVRLWRAILRLFAPMM